ncbi:MAG: GNAT family N-acetyltransferase [Nitriliruptorales bacterium]|nr:GNAT family N-acetyltransferase [Nitriliruptorales bacterium]
MTTRRVGLLDADALDGLPARCASCVFWELGGPRPATNGVTAEGTATKRAWVAGETLADGPPGRGIRIDDEVVAYVLFAPAGALAGRGPAVPTPSPDALVLATTWVEPQWRQHGLGRLLVQAALREAHRREVGAVEAWGDRRFSEGGCVLPAAWLLHEGFVVHREHPRHPLMRIDVRRTAAWADSLEQAVAELLERVRPSLARNGAPVPSPAGPVRRGASTP